MSEKLRNELEIAREILEEYSEPHIDIGNVYFAATTFRNAHDELQQWCDRFEDFIRRDWKTDNKINIAKEALKLFEDYQDFKSRQEGEK